MPLKAHALCVWLYDIATYIRYTFMHTIYVTVLAKTCLVRTKTEFNFIATVYRHTQYLSITSVSSVKC